MHSSPARRQARRIDGGPPRRGAAARRLAIAFPLFLFGAMAVLAVVGFIAVVSAYSFYSQGLTDPRELERIEFKGVSVITDRTGKIELARFGTEQREEVTFEQIAPILIDATTAIEDKSFWTNTGFDPLGFASATVDTIQGDSRGGSTITQQLVRQRLLDPRLVQDSDRRIERKIKEIIQSVRVTQAYPGQDGKRRIMTAYLNQNFYGNNSYGVKAAARSYFGVADLSKLTLAQAAILAALPQSPSNYDLVRNAVEREDGTLYVPDDTQIVQRRNHILDLLATDPSRRTLTGDKYSAADFEKAKRETVELVRQQAPRWKAPHFVWAVRKELAARLCGEDAETCPTIERGGLKVVTTLDMTLQESAERWVKAATILPKQKDPRAYARRLGVPLQPWMTKLRDKDLHNGAMIAMDYQTGEIVAYVGSADYYARRTTPQFQPQFDVLGDGFRQPGSAFKPFNYVTGIHDRQMTASTMFMDVTTNFGGANGGYVPTNFDQLERGPLRLRSALQFSLNIPAVKALAVNGEQHVFDVSKRFGMRFAQDEFTGGPSFALGTLEVRPVDLVTAWSTLANGGRHLGHTRIRQILDRDGKDLVPPYEPPRGQQIVSPQAAYIMTDILEGNTDPKQNPFWGEREITSGDGRHRPATLKTGTNNDAKDLNAYGYVAPPDAGGRDAGEYALVVGAWNGNSDNSLASTPGNPIFALDAAAPMWEGFLEEVTKDWEVRPFPRPDGVVEAEVDAWSGMRPGPYSKKTVKEVFIEGTVPKEDDTKRAIDVVPGADGKFVLWREGCAGPPEKRGFLDLEKAEADHPDWQDEIRDWIARARRGPGVAGGPENTSTSYFFNGSYQPYGEGWGGPFPPTETCLEAPSPSPSPSASPSPSPSASPTASPSASASPSPSPSPSPTPSPTRSPSPSPSPTPTRPPTASPSPTPTRTVRPPPSGRPSPLVSIVPSPSP